LQSSTPKRIAVPPLAALLAQLVPVLVDELHQQLDVGRPADGVADRVQLQAQAGHAAAPVPPALQGDHLGIDGGIVRADHLHAELVVLARPAALHGV
jgi:hypothetical protein